MRKAIVTARDVIARRKRLGMNQVELARATGFSTSGISQIETGQRNPGKRFLAALEEVERRAAGGHPVDHIAALEDAMNRIISLESRMARLERVQILRSVSAKPPRRLFKT